MGVYLDLFTFVNSVPRVDQSLLAQCQAKPSPPWVTWVAPLVSFVVINGMRVMIYAFLFSSLVNDWEANNLGMEGEKRKRHFYLKRRFLREKVQILINECTLPESNLHILFSFPTFVHFFVQPVSFIFLQLYIHSQLPHDSLYTFHS